jgi:hypothetical protein
MTQHHNGAGLAPAATGSEARGIVHQAGKLDGESSKATSNETQGGRRQVVRQVAVYVGRDCIGYIGRVGRVFTALSIGGRVLGNFASMIEASNALSRNSARVRDHGDCA